MNPTCCIWSLSLQKSLNPPEVQEFLHDDLTSLQTVVLSPSGQPITVTPSYTSDNKISENGCSDDWKEVAISVPQTIIPKATHWHLVCSSLYSTLPWKRHSRIVSTLYLPSHRGGPEESDQSCFQTSPLLMTLLLSRNCWNNPAVWILDPHQSTVRVSWQLLNQYD